MLHAIASAFIGAVAFISSLFGVYAQLQADPTVGSSLPSGTAVFETSLQSRISSTDTTLTLVANNVRGGSTLSGYQCFTIDEGRTDSEYVCGTVSGTTVSSLTRGVDPSTGTTTNSTLKFAHRVGANVKITDFPLLQILRNQAAGTDTYSNVLRYASGVTPSATGDLTDKEYVDGLAFSGAGVIDASSIARGVVELATQTETASSTANGSSGVLVIPTSNATSTYNSATAPMRVVVTQNSGKIDSNFISTSTLFSGFTSGTDGNFSITGTSTIASTTLYATTTTGTWTKPSNLKYVIVEVIGGGGGGGGSTNNYTGSGGGGGGGYCKRVINASAITSTVTVTIGAAGTAGAGTGGNGGAGGNSSFGSYCTANGGSGGVGNLSAQTGGAGGAGGTASGGSINITGGNGGAGNANAVTAANLTVGGNGGSSQYGQGAPFTSSIGTTETPGSAGTGFGAGGSGSTASNTNNDAAGGAGTAGAVFIETVFF